MSITDIGLEALAAIAVLNFLDVLAFIYVVKRHGATGREALTPGSGFRLFWKHRKGGAA